MFKVFINRVLFLSFLLSMCFRAESQYRFTFKDINIYLANNQLDSVERYLLNLIPLGDKETSEYYYLNGIVSKSNRNYDVAKKYLDSSFLLAKKQHNTHLMVYNLLHSGAVYTAIKDYTNANKCFLYAVDLYTQELIDDKEFYIAVNTWLMRNYEVLNDSLKRDYYSYKAFHLLIHKKNKSVLDFKDLGQMLNTRGEYDSANIYFKKGLELCEHKENFLTAQLMLNISENLFSIGKYEEGITYAQKAFVIGRQLEEVGVLSVSLNLLRECSIALKDSSSALFYGLKLDSINKVDRTLAIETIKDITLSKDLTKEEVKRGGRFLFLVIGLSILVLVVFVWFLWKKNQTKIVKEKPLVQSQHEMVESSIREEVVEDITKGLAVFEEEKQYLNSSCTLSNASKLMQTNSSYLSFVIKSKFNKTFKEYVNDLRMKETIRLIQEDANFRNYSMDFMAQEVGFKSRQAFSELFKKTFKMTVREFVDSSSETNNK